MSEALGIPLYRAGDTVSRPPSPSATREEEDGERLLASVGPVRAALARRKPKVTSLTFSAPLTRDVPIAGRTRPLFYRVSWSQGLLDECCCLQ